MRLVLVTLACTTVFGSLGRAAPVKDEATADQQQKQSLNARPIQERVDIARLAQAEQLTRVAERLEEQLDLLLKVASAKGDLKQSRQLRSQIDDFRENGTVPASPATTKVVAEYRIAVNKSRETLITELKAAQADFTRILKLEEAQELVSEIEILESDRPSRHTKTAATATKDLMKEGSVWRGVLTQRWRKGPKEYSEPRQYPVEIRIVSRDGNQFRARIDIQGGENVRECMGTLSNSGVIRISAADIELKQGVGKIFDHYGRLNQEAIGLNFSGISPQGEQTAGYYSLQMVH
jgi:hypothetical protein